MRPQDLIQANINHSTKGPTPPTINAINTDAPTIETSPHKAHKTKRNAFINFSHQSKETSHKEEKYIKGLEIVRKLKSIYQQAFNTVSSNSQVSPYKVEIERLEGLVEIMQKMYQRIYKESYEVEDGYFSDHSELFAGQKYAIDEQFEQIEALYQKIKSNCQRAIIKLEKIMAINKETLTNATQQAVVATVGNIEPKISKKGAQRCLDFSLEEEETCGNEPTNKKLRMDGIG